MNRTKQNKSISARKRYKRMFFYFIEKHMQKFRHFWRKKISPEKVTYVPLAPSHSIEASARCYNQYIHVEDSVRECKNESTYDITYNSTTVTAISKLINISYRITLEKELICRRDSHSPFFLHRTAKKCTVPRFMTHMQSHYSAHLTYCLETFPFLFSM